MGTIPLPPPMPEVVDIRIGKVDDTTWNIECSFRPPPYQPLAGRKPLPSEMPKGADSHAE